jgi:hypothetical protein
MHHVWSGGVRSAAGGNGAGHLSRAGEALVAPEHKHGAIPVVVPSPVHITEPVLRHTSLGESPSNWLDATVCRYRFGLRDAPLEGCFGSAAYDQTFPMARPCRR